MQDIIMSPFCSQSAPSHRTITFVHLDLVDGATLVALAMVVQLAGSEESEQAR